MFIAMDTISLADQQRAGSRSTCTKTIAIDVNALRQYEDPLPTEPGQQNKLWYRWYYAEVPSGPPQVRSGDIASTCSVAPERLCIAESARTQPRPAVLSGNWDP